VRFNRASLYWGGLATQVAGTIAILWHGIPIYRQFLTGATDQKADGEVIAWAVVSVVAIQSAYWGARKLLPSVNVPRSVVLGHAALFAARVNFVFAGALLTVFVFVRFQEIEFSFWRSALLIAVLFSLFCTTLELERLGKRLGEL
jgi:hypothetical protein